MAKIVCSKLIVNGFIYLRCRQRGNRIYWDSALHDEKNVTVKNSLGRGEWGGKFNSTFHNSGPKNRMIQIYVRILHFEIRMKFTFS